MVNDQKLESQTLDNHRYSEMTSLNVERANGYRRLAVEGYGVTFDYSSKKENPILNGLDINVEKGGIYGLLGPSGCGKTTLLRTILGRLVPSEGTIKVFGRSPGEKGSCIPGNGVGYMPQDLALALDMTIEEILVYFGRLYLMEKKCIMDRISFLLDFLEIPKKESFIKNLSGGQKRRVSLAAALIHEPPLLILDEPTVGVDPLLRHSIWKHLKSMTEKGCITIIITTHYVEEARQAHTVGLMREGHLLAEMNPETLIRQYGVQNLEDVFWRLCRKESEFVNQENQDDHSAIPIMPNGADCGKHAKVWLTRQELRSVEKDIEVVTSNGIEECSNRGASLLCNDEDFNEKKIYHQASLFTRIRQSQRRMATLIAKSFLCFWRNRIVAFFQLFLPPFEIIFFSMCIGHAPFDLPLAIVNDEAGKYGFSGMLINSLNNHTFKKQTYENLSSAIDSVENGKSWGALYIGPRFSSSTMDRLLEGSNVEDSTIDNSIIKLHMDASNQQIAITILYNILRSFEAFAKEMLTATYQNPKLSAAPILLEKPVYGKLESNFTEFMTPGAILGIIYITAMGLTALAIILERKAGLLDRSWVAGVGAVEVIFSIVFCLFVTMIVQVILALIVAIFIVGLPSKGSIVLLFICVILGGTSGMGNGLLISALCSEEVEAMMFAVGSFYPIVVISGILWPVEGMEYYLRYISYCTPLSLLSDSMRSVMSRGWGFTEHFTWVGFAVPFAWTLIFLFGSILIFKIRKL